MQRRDLLRAGAALIGPAAVGSAARVGPGSSGRVEEYGPLASLDVPNAREAVVGDDDRVYLATIDGYATVDASDPADPTVGADVQEVSSADGRLRRIWDVKYDDDRLLVAGQRWNGGNGTLGFALMDVSDPRNPDQLLFEPLDFSVHNCYLDGDLAFLTSGPNDGDTFTVYDVAGGEATELTRWRAVDANEAWQAPYDEGGPGAHDLWVHDGLAYTASWNAGVFVVDVSDPADPQYVTEFGGLDPGDLADMSEDERRREVFRPPGNAHYVATDPAGDLLGVGGEAWKYEGAGGPMGIDLYDVSDPADPELLSTVEPPESPAPTMDGTWTTAHNFEIRDDVLYSSWYEGGVRRHDVSDPTEPVEETWWRRPSEASFWTARVLQPGETFVASSKGHGRRGHDAALYVFPDEPGRSLAPYEATPTPDDRTPTPEDRTATPADRTATPDDRTATPGDGRDSPTADPPAGSSPTSTPESSPGFGPVATLTAFGYGLWRFGARLDD